MAKPTSPSSPHRSEKNPDLHVDIRGKNNKIHANVKNPLGAYAIGAAQRDAARKQKGRS